jgi:superfamily II DNA or RNA helicase
MMTTQSYVPREYQQKVLDRLLNLRGSNVLLELDCGMGKRFITHQIVTELFSELRIIIIVNSRPSLVETSQYLREEYGGLDDDVGELGSHTASRIRKSIMQESRIVIATPHVLNNVLDMCPRSTIQFDLVIVNEVDTLVRRVGDGRVLVRPWPQLLERLAGKWFIGMSGTLRDDHVVMTGKSFSTGRDLDTLRRHFDDPEIIRMDELQESDIDEHITKTTVEICPVADKTIRTISIILDEAIKNTRAEVSKKDGRIVDAKVMHHLIDKLHVSERLKGQYIGLLFLRKHLFAMPQSEILWKLRSSFVSQFFNPEGLDLALGGISTKTQAVRRIVLEHQKSVVLCSYLKTVDCVMQVLQESGVTPFRLTGQVFSKAQVLRDFKEYEEKAALIMSPVGERDLDIPEAQTLIVYDTTGTTKTMYQRMKRIREGRVVFLVYEETSEERKVERLIDEIISKYPWSTRRKSH